MIRGLHHVSLKCSTPAELEETRRFYCDVLGLRLHRQWPAGMLLDTGSGLIEVFLGEGGIRAKGAVRHLALACSDVDAAAEAVRWDGRTVFIGPKEIELPSDPPVRARMAFCIGPLGEEIEFFDEH